MGILRKNFQEEHSDLPFGRPSGRKCMPFGNDAHEQLDRAATVHIHSSPRRHVLTIALIASLCGSAEGGEPVRSRPLSAEQISCANRAAAQQRAKAMEFTRRQVEAMKAQRSTIELTLQERRMNEAACLEEAKCFGGGDLVYGVMFDSCLKRVEREVD